MIGLAKDAECVHRECYFPVWSCSLENWTGGRLHFARSMKTAVQPPCTELDTWPYKTSILGASANLYTTWAVQARML